MSISFKQLNNKINSIRFNERLVWAAIKSIIQTITGNAPLILTNAVNNSITSLTQYGLCTQDGTPTPSAPVDIMCNNGALRMVHRSGLPSGYRLLDSVGSSGLQYVITDLYLASTDVIECEYRNSSTTGYGAIYGIYKTGESSALYGNQTYYGYDESNNKVDTDIRVDTEWHSSRHDFVNGTLTIDNTTVTFTPFTFVNSTKNAVLSRYYNGSYGYNWKGYLRKFKVTRNGEVVCDLLPAKNSDGDAGLYDLVTGTFYTATGGTLLEGNEVDDYELRVVGTPEVLTVGGPNLLNPATNITGKYIDGAGKIKDGTDAQYTDLIPVTAGETYLWTLISNRAGGGNNRCHGYDSAGNWVKQIAFDASGQGLGLPFLLIATIPNGISYVRLSYGINDTDAMFKKQNYDQLINTFYEAAIANGVPFIKDYSTPVQSPYNSWWKVGVYFEAIPGGEYAFSHDVFQNGTYASGNQINVGFYEKAEDVTDTSKCLSHLKSFAHFTVPNEAHYVVIEFEGSKPFTFSFVALVKVDNDYQPYVQPQTASVPTLLSVGDVKDEVELIHGTLTRRVTACLYDGTQPVGDVYMSTTGGKDAGAIIVYPLATPTTEHITGQNLVTNEGTNIVDVTAEVSPVELKVNFSQTKE